MFDTKEEVKQYALANLVDAQYEIIYINTDLFGIVSSAVVALVIYFISYNEIDDRKIKREDNAKDTAKVLLADTYKECLNTLELLGNREILEAFIVPKVDFNKTNKDDKIMNNLQTLPFESFDKIISLSEGGYISKDKLEIYLSIKKEFALVVSMKITFFDIDKAQGLKQILYKEEIDRRFYDLINTINNEKRNSIRLVKRLCRLGRGLYRSQPQFRC